MPSRSFNDRGQRPPRAWLALPALPALLIAAAAAPAADFIAFESGPVRPLALSPDGRMLFVTNTPDNHLEIFNISGSGTLAHLASVPVGMEPVAVAARSASEVWVVNHLSDSVSIVDIGSLLAADSTTNSTAFVRRTLLVGDEPRDIVFARDRAFVTTAHRGQHRTHPSIAAVPGAGTPQLHTAGIGRADVWVFDAKDPGAGVGGSPLRIVELFGDTPRALAVSPDGSTVYAAVFHSGNQTTVIHEGVMCRGFEDTPRGFFVGATWDRRRGDQPCVAGNLPALHATASPNGPEDKTLPMGRPLPSTGADGEHAPFTAMIVKWDEESGEWRDSRGLNYSNGIRFFLPDKDVFAIDAATLAEKEHFAHVGTTLFNMATNPKSGHIYVANTDARNHVRFEGPGVRGGSTVQGKIARAQITVIDPVTGTVRKRHLNRHIDYSVLKSTAAVRRHSLSTPLELQVSSDGTTLYVAALGSDRIGVFDTADLEDDSLWDGNGREFDPTSLSANYLAVAGGPAGLLLDEAHNRPNGQLYVFAHFERSVKVVDAVTGDIRQTSSFHNPEPAEVVTGRRVLYDATRTSSNGESSCATCHVFGDSDHLSWNLSNPDDGNTANPQPFPTFSDFWLSCDIFGHYPGCEAVPYVNGNGDQLVFSPMKGPMFTQTMRGMSTHGHMHWRGDRATGYFGSDDQKTLDEKFSFKNFIVAFESLLGLDVVLTDSAAAAKPADVIQLERDVDEFADFMLAVQLPPNPIKPLNSAHSPSARIGDAFFDGPRRADGVDAAYDLPNNRNGAAVDGRNCAGYHRHDPSRGFFGTAGDASHGGEVLILKVPHLRNLYQKVGMFGLPNREYFLPSTTDAHQGDQIRGFGFLHDGATDKLFNFLQGAVFDDGTTTCDDLGLPGARGWRDVFGCGFSDGMDIGIPDDEVRQGLVDYLMEFDTDLAPIVGQQVTLGAANGPEANPRVDLLMYRARVSFQSAVLGGSVTERDLIAKGTVAGKPRGWVRLPSGNFLDDVGERWTPSRLRTLATDTTPVTYTCTPPGSGRRMGIDRDRDTILDGHDNCPAVFNRNQGDADADGIGDACETLSSR
ncbi:MAG: hypothetical protein OXG81_08330 [Acidobacteria bacterium]|nr:hypothetical protein [Acidobacteriota bacterium]